VLPAGRARWQCSGNACQQRCWRWACGAWAAPLLVWRWTRTVLLFAACKHRRLSDDWQVLPTLSGTRNTNRLDSAAFPHHLSPCVKTCMHCPCAASHPCGGPFLPLSSSLSASALAVCTVAPMPAWHRSHLPKLYVVLLVPSTTQRIHVASFTAAVTTSHAPLAAAPILRRSRHPHLKPRASSRRLS
jgi:hypothetical protein